jgi:hypothetical protein
VCVTQRVHRDKVHIDAKLVRQLLKAQLPHLADLEVQAVPAQGTDNVVFRLGGELSVRLPRKPAAVRGVLVEMGVVAAVSPAAAARGHSRSPFRWQLVSRRRYIPSRGPSAAGSAACRCRPAGAVR